MQVRVIKEVTLQRTHETAAKFSVLVSFPLCVCVHVKDIEQKFVLTFLVSY